MAWQSQSSDSTHTDTFTDAQTHTDKHTHSVLYLTDSLPSVGTLTLAISKRTVLRLRLSPYPCKVKAMQSKVKESCVKRDNRHPTDTQQSVGHPLSTTGKQASNSRTSLAELHKLDRTLHEWQLPFLANRNNREIAKVNVQGQHPGSAECAAAIE